MAVLQMQKLCICALKKDRKSLMEFLQAAGVLELSAEAERLKPWQKPERSEERREGKGNRARGERE